MMAKRFNGTALGVALAPSRQIGLDDFSHLASVAEQRGYHSIWVPETWGYDAVSLLAAIAVRTERIRIAAGIFNVYSRSPALIAQTAATLQHLSGGRFILGLGSSGPAVVERWHGLPFGDPISRTQQAVSIIRAALEGQEVNATLGEARLAGFRLGNPPPSPPPIYLAALSARNVRLAGETADGWLPIFLPRGALSDLRRPLDEGARAAGRPPESISVAAYLPAAFGPAGNALLRQQIAYYVGSMGAYYHRFVSRSGFATEANAIRSAWQSGRPRVAVDLVPGSLVDICTLGTGPESAETRLAQYRSEGVDLPIVSLPHGMSAEEAARTIEGLAPA